MKNMSQRDKKLLILAVALFLAALFLVLYILFWNDEGSAKENGPVITSPEETFKYFSPLTGLGVREAKDASPRTVAVMIDNSPEAYPLSGLNEAAVVYEAPVEGVIPRLMAIYAESSTVEKVGPVRSARPYYLDWAAEYGNVLYMHCGGSADGLAEIKAQKIFDANEFFRGPYFWRESARVAPHNLFTNASRWQKYFIDYGGTREFGDWSGWQFGDLPATGTAKISFVKIKYGERFLVEWRYSTTSSWWERYLGGEIFLDDKNNPVVADNIIIEYADVSVIDAIGRRSIATLSGGDDARIMAHGQMARGVWKKDKTDSRTEFYTEAGEKILLPPGRTWVMIVPQKTSVEFGS
ncbi:MAG: DUF3048 domain-containing protein [Patescibacteria group bacterium]|nr:DUF3048 domain-containing protein [Patescibacteria group bacterium]